MEIVHSLENTNFYIMENGKMIAELNYDIIDRAVISIDHVWVRRDKRGNDIGKFLLDAAREYCINNNMKAIPVCPYVKMMFKRNHQYYEKMIKED